MAAQPMEMILVKQLASYLAVPIWVTDADGNLVYYNPPAERLVGASFDEVGVINAEALPQVFKTTDFEGNPIDSSDLSVARALATKSPAHGALRFWGLNQVARDVEVTAIPITGQGDRFLGVMVTFWEIDP